MKILLSLSLSESVIAGAATFIEALEKNLSNLSPEDLLPKKNKTFWGLGNLQESKLVVLQMNPYGVVFDEVVGSWALTLTH